MAALVWLTTAVAIWHFTVFVPDRFWSGIVGAFIGSVIGGMISGALFQIALGKSIGETDLLTVAFALPGAIIGMAIVYWIGARQESEAVRV